MNRRPDPPAHAGGLPHSVPAGCPVCAADGRTSPLLTDARLDEILALEAHRPDLRIRILEVFSTSTHESLQQCRTAHARGDRPALVHAAHRLMGSATSLGATRLSRLAAQAERQAQAGGDADALAGLLDSLAQTRQDTLAAYRRWLAAGP